MVASLIILAAVQAVQAAPPPPGADLKIFEFRGVTAGSERPEEELKRCKVIEPDVRQCVIGDTTVAGAPAFVIETFYRAKLTHLYINTARDNWQALGDAFVAKYGAPCETETRQWRNGAGAVLPNPVQTWCFTSGKLRLQRYGRRITESVASYTDSNQPPEAAAKVDF